MVGLAIVVGTALFIVARQPLGAPWWFYGDADATYVGTGLNVAVGGHITYADHPGLVEEELLGLSFEAASLRDGGPTRAWASNEMLHLDHTRPVFRGWAVLFFAGGAVWVFALLTRLFGHWTWGTAGGLLWLAQPELPDVMQIRPDVLLALLGFTAVYVIVRGAERRSALMYVFAAVLIGFTFMVKVPAAALTVPLFLATLVSYPGQGWPRQLRDALLAWSRRHRAALTVTALAWAAAALLLNLRAPGMTGTGWNWNYVTEALLLVFVYLAAGLVVRQWSRNRLLRRIFDPLYVVLLLALVVGMLIPTSLYYGDGFRSIGSAVGTLFGGNLNKGIQPFSGPFFDLITHYPLREPALVFVAAALGALWGLTRYDPRALLWFSGAAVAGAMAAARLDYPRYFALAYVLSIPAALTLFRRTRTAAAPLILWPLVAFVVFPTLRHSGDDAVVANRQEAVAARMRALGDRFLKPGEFAFIPDYFQYPDADWYDYLQYFTDFHPLYPFRYVPDRQQAFFAARDQGKQPRYYIGPLAPGTIHAGLIDLANSEYRAKIVNGSPATGLSVVRLSEPPTR